VGKGAATRQAIVDEALRQALRDGLEGISLGVLAQHTGLSKSGLFAHFKSKEALQLAVLDEATERFRQRVVVPALSRPRGPDRLANLFRRYLDWMREGCLFSVVAQEIDRLPPSVAAAFLAGQSAWRETIGRVTADALGPEVDAADVAFEFVGLALAYQQAVKVFNDGTARRRALSSFTRRLEVVP
jgi:AcrR family transcriptional regulator